MRLNKLMVYNHPSPSRWELKKKHLCPPANATHIPPVPSGR